MPDTIAGPADLANRVVAFMVANGIENRHLYTPQETAARVVKAVHPVFLQRHLAAGDDYLRQMCREIADWEHLTPDEQLTEDYYHGHGDKPRQMAAAA